MRRIHTRVERMCFAGVSSGLATVVLSALLLSCSDPTGPVREPRNTFTDWQHIQGKVCGVWTKDHNPHVITGPVIVEDGDSLVVQNGTVIIANYDIELNARDKDGYIRMDGTSLDPIHWAMVGSDYWAMLFTYAGEVRLNHVIVEGEGKVLDIGGAAIISNSIFAESNLMFSVNAPGRSLIQKDSIAVRSSVFFGFRPWNAPTTQKAQIFTSADAYLDSTLTIIANCLFFGPIGDSLPTGGPLVNVRYKGASGIRTVSGMAWPGNGNIYANPQWVRYSYIGPNPTGLSDNDYHLLPGSPAMGAGADGGNIGAY